MPDNNIYLLPHLNLLADLYAEISGKKFKSIGIISPYLTNEIVLERNWLNALMRLCSYRLLITHIANQQASQFISILHQTGFYLTEALFEHSQRNYGTEALLPNGLHAYYTKQPGIIYNQDPAWVTYAACRVKDDALTQYPWKGILGKLISDENSTVSAVDQLSLSVYGAHQAPPEAMQASLIGATAIWSSSFNTHSHVSLVSCYHGPSDTSMYIFMLEVADDQTALLSLWINHSTWTRLESITLTTEQLSKQGENYSLNLWLKVSIEGLITAGIDSKLIFSRRDQSLPKNHVLGIRMSDDKISLSNIRTEYLTGNN